MGSWNRHAQVQQGSRLCRAATTTHASQMMKRPFHTHYAQLCPCVDVDSHTYLVLWCPRRDSCPAYATKSDAHSNNHAQTQA
jgi:hypothetical protein